MDQQPYLLILYRAILAMGYHGMFRIRELTLGPHAIRAANVHIGRNKDKIQVVLYSSKTHTRADPSQKVKISANYQSTNKPLAHFCPFNLVRRYLTARKSCHDLNEQFFIFSDGTPVKPCHVKAKLRSAIKSLGLRDELYDTHSLRIGRSCDLVKFGIPVQQIMLMGRWKSNAVFKYIKKV